MTSPASTLLGLWNWHSPAWLAAAAAVALYFRLHRGFTGGRPAFFLAAVAVFLLATVSPINRLAFGYLFSVHMVHHLLLLLVAPGLALVSFSPDALLALARRFPVLGKLGWFFSRPLVAWPMGAAAMTFWHVSTFCVASQTVGAVTNLQTASLLLMGAAFWSPILSPVASARVGALQGVGYLFTGCLSCTALGIYLTFSPVNVCPSFLTAADPLGLMPYLRGTLGLTPDVDQHIGGLIMWIPACLVYMTGVFILLARWYARPETVAAPEMAHPAPAKD